MAGDPGRADRPRQAAALPRQLARERGRAFAIKNGQIENLYTLRRAVIEELMAEGLEGVMGAHTPEGHPDRTI